MFMCRIIAIVIEFTSSLCDQVLLHVVAVDLRPAEDDGLVHLVLLNCANCVLALQDFDGL